jgi:hypothetical protein
MGFLPSLLGSDLKKEKRAQNWKLLKLNLFCSEKLEMLELISET